MKSLICHGMYPFVDCFILSDILKWPFLSEMYLLIIVYILHWYSFLIINTAP